MAHGPCEHPGRAGTAQALGSRSYEPRLCWRHAPTGRLPRSSAGLAEVRRARTEAGTGSPAQGATLWSHSQHLDLGVGDAGFELLSPVTAPGIWEQEQPLPHSAPQLQTSRVTTLTDLLQKSLWDDNGKKPEGQTH